MLRHTVRSVRGIIPQFWSAYYNLIIMHMQTPIFRQRLQTIFELEVVEHERCSEQQTLHITKNPLHLYRPSKGTVLKDTH